MKILRVLLILVLFTLSVWGEKTIDLSERILKCEKMQGFGDIGFGLYDHGDSKYKVFDWKLNKKAEIPILIGEGKAELKGKRLNAFILKNLLYLCAENDRKISVFDLKGKFIRDFRIDIDANSLKLNDQKLYAFNPSFFEEMKGKQTVFFKIIDPQTSKLLEVVPFNEKLSLQKVNGENPSSFSGFFLFDVLDSSNLFVLDPINNVIYHMMKNGKIKSKTQLPYKTLIKFQTKNYPDKTVFIKRTVNFYTGFRVIKGDYYVAYVKVDYTSNGENSQDKTILLKVKTDGTYKEKNLAGINYILDISSDSLYLYDFFQFYITAVDLKSWK